MENYTPPIEPLFPDSTMHSGDMIVVGGHLYRVNKKGIDKCQYQCCECKSPLVVNVENGIIVSIHQWKPHRSEHLTASKTLEN